MKKLYKLILSILILISLIVPAIPSSAGAPVVITDQARTQTVDVFSGQLNNISKSYLTALSEGLFPDRELFSKSAHSAVINTAEQAFWSVPPATQTEYVWLTSAEILQVASSDADDTAAGTGARTIQITGLLAGYIEDTETITLNGTTNVPTTKSFLRVNDVEVLTAGSSGKNEGNITVSNNADTNILSYMVAGENIAEQLIYTVPAGKSFSIVNMEGSGAGTKNVHIHIYTRAENGLFISKNHRTVNDSPYFMSHDLLAEKTDFMCVVHSDTNGGVADITVKGALITNP
jgi:hypothetical protein